MYLSTEPISNEIYPTDTDVVLWSLVCICNIFFICSLMFYLAIRSPFKVLGTKTGQFCLYLYCIVIYQLGCLHWLISFLSYICESGCFITFVCFFHISYIVVSILFGLKHGNLCYSYEDI